MITPWSATASAPCSRSRTPSSSSDAPPTAGRRGGGAAARPAPEAPPDTALLDVQMPNVDGIEALRLIRAENPEARVIVLTTYRNEDYIFPALDAGARGYLLKDASRAELAAAVRAVHRGE